MNNGENLTINEIFNLAVKNHQEGRLDIAQELYNQVLKVDSKNKDTLNNLAVIFIKLKEFQKAKDCYEKVIEANPGNAKALNNLGRVFKTLRQDLKAKSYYEKAIEINPDFTDAYNNLGIIFTELKDYKKAQNYFEKTIKLNPNFADAHNNLGNIFQESADAHKNLGNKFRESDNIKRAKICYEKAIELNPNFVDAHNNLGTIFYKLGKNLKSKSCCEKAIAIDPDYAAAHNNLGILFYRLGDNLKAINCYEKVLEIDANYPETWNNIFYPLQAIKLQASSIEDHLPLFNKQITSKYAKISKSILSYRLNLGSPSTGSSLDEVISILSSTDNNFIKNPKLPSSELSTALTLPKKITVLVHFGRSGTGLLHSLIDGHPEVSTLPSIYFSEFFDHFAWEKIIAGGWDQMVDRFIKTYAVLFDASSTVKISSRNNQLINNIGVTEGMTTVGPERNEVLSIDKKVFIKELNQLMNYQDRLNPFTFFKLVHAAYEKAINNHNEKDLIFYHIHNPDTCAQLNFLRLAPSANWLMMVREPIQNCESWVRKDFHDNNYDPLAYTIFQMLFEIDQTIYRKDNSIGVRLEDLKRHPKKTIPALCRWLGIKEKDSLYQMTAQGKKWWGDPSSPNYNKDGMKLFDETSINRKLGSVFTKKDQFILRTLFYPFSVRFSYAEENLEQFKKDLLKIRPMIDQMFDFEKKIAQQTKMSEEKFMKAGSYLYLRSGMIERWNTLNKFHTYPNMLNPLIINQ